MKKSLLKGAGIITLGLSVDAKRCFLHTDASWIDATGAELLRTQHENDPWVVSAGLAFRF